MHQILNPTLVICAAILALPQAAAQSSFTIIASGNSTDANSDGTAISGNDNQGAFLWTSSGGYQPLGQQSAVGVSEDGTTVLGQMDDPATGDNVAGLWTSPTGWVNLGNFGGGCGSDVANPYDLAGDGNTAVGLGWLGCTGIAFRWTVGGGLMPIPHLGSGSARASVISDDGAWVGGWDEATNGSRRAALWDANLTEQLILVSGSNPTGAGEINGLSSDGSFAVGSEGSAAFIWNQTTGATNLGQIPGGGFLDNTLLLCVDQAGQVAGGTFGFGPFGDAIIWTPAHGYRFLSDVLTGLGIDMSAWEPAVVTAISDDGKTLIGHARAAGSFSTSVFVAVLDGNSVGTDYCNSAVANSSGSPGSMSASGSSSPSANNLELQASDLPPGKFAFFLNSASPGFIPNPGGSQGHLCLTGAIGRHNGQIGMVDPAGVFAISLDLTSLPRPTGNVSVLPGETWFFQCWYRDSNPGTTSNFTNGLEILFQ